MSNAGKQLTVLGHLSELRAILGRSVIALVITTVISFIFADRLFAILLRPAGGTRLIYTEMTEMVGTWMKVCLFGGIVLAAPFIIFQLLAFVSPALTRREKKYLYLVLPLVCLMFIGGVLFGYFVLLPPAVTTLEATLITDHGATLRGNLDSRGSASPVEVFTKSALARCTSWQAFIFCSSSR